MNKLQIQKIAKKYAEAIAEINSSDSLLAEIKAVASAINDSPEVSFILFSPSIKAEEKKELIRNSLNSKVSEILINFIELLIDKRRTEVLFELAESYQTVLNRKANNQVAELEYAGELASESLSEIKAKLEKLLNSSVTINTTNNPDLIAGFRVKVAGKLLDQSVASRFENLSKELVK